MGEILFQEIGLIRHLRLWVLKRTASYFILNLKGIFWLIENDFLA